MLVFFSLNVLFIKNTIYSILYLIGCFLSTSIILLSYGLDYIPLLFINIYVGALSVLFIFVIIMLNIKIYGEEDLLLLRVCFFLISSFLIVYNYYDVSIFLWDNTSRVDLSFTMLHSYQNPIIVLGVLLFNFYNFQVVLAGFVLFVAMIGSVTLVLDLPKFTKNQFIYKQLSTSYNSSYFKVS